MNIEEVEGIGPVHAASLQGAGIATTDALLERGASAGGRAELAAAAGVSPKLVLEWVNHVDLMRIDGVGSEYSDLLEAAGVDSPAELAQRNAANLAQTFQELDAARPDWIRRVPSEATVEGWIEQAKALPKIVTHGGGGSGGSGESRAGEGATAAEKAASTAADSAPTSVAGAPTAREGAPTAAGSSVDAPDVDGTEAEVGMPAAFSAPIESAPAPRTAEPMTAKDRSGGEGLWSRVKRLFGG